MFINWSGGVQYNGVVKMSVEGASEQDACVKVTVLVLYQYIKQSFVVV